MTLPPHRMDYSPIVDRPVIKWPNNARVAFWVAPNVEHYGTSLPWMVFAIPGPVSPIPTCSNILPMNSAIGWASGGCWRC